jgi:hypothetical protein
VHRADPLERARQLIASIVKQSLAGKLLRAIAARRGSIIAPVSPGWQRERALIADTRPRTQLLLTDPAALHLLVCARAASFMPGAFAEAGVFKGGSARLICEEKGDAELHLFDVFETLQRGVRVEGGDVQAHFGATYATEVEVRQLLAAYPNVHFHVGVFPETARALQDRRFSFVHIDLDLPQAMIAALEYFHPLMAAGGILLADDYDDPDVKACLDSWLNTRHDTLIELPWSQLMIIRQGG